MMDNTNNTHQNNINDITDHFSGDDANDRQIDLPPLPPSGVRGDDVCAVIRLYLALWDDLSDAQKNVVSQHLQLCPSCTREQQLLTRATQMVQSMAASEPSARVDQAVLAAIATRRQAAASSRHQTDDTSPVPLPSRKPSRRGGFSVRMVSLLVAAVVICAFALSLVLYWALGPSQQTFTLPANLSWNSYVLFSKQTMMSNKGVPYNVIRYDDMQAGMVNVETVMDGKLDVVVVANQQEALGLDRMHHVAQWNATDWMSDSSYFDLATLRQDLRDKKAVYVGKEHFQGQDVYCIRYTDGHMLLLDKNYMPVNVLEPEHSQGASPSQGKPMYDTLQWLPPSKVAPSMWNMQVPQGFEPGKLPAHP